MENWKYFALFNKLNPDEQNTFHKYLKENHGGEEIVLRVFGYFKKFPPDFSSGQKPDLEYAIAKIFRKTHRGRLPSRKYLLNIFAKLNNRLSDFLIQQKVEEPSIIRDLLWLRILQERELFEDFERESLSFVQANTQTLPKSLEDSLLHISAAYMAYQSKVHSPKAAEPEWLEQSIRLIREAADTMCSRIEYEWDMLRSYQTPAEPSPSPAPAPLREVYNALSQLRNPEVQEKEYYLSLAFEKLTGNPDAFEPHEISMLAKHLRNYAAERLTQGDLYVNLLHKLSEFSRDRKIFAEHIGLSQADFNNIVTFACKAQKLDWADDFIDSTQKLLPDEIRDETVAVARATVAFEREDYKSVIAFYQIWQDQFNIWTNELRARLLVLRAWYLVRDTQIDLLEEIERFSQWLKRKREHSYKMMAGIKGFTKVYKEMAKQKIENSALETLLASQGGRIILSDWLKAQLPHYKARFAPRKRNSRGAP